MNWHLRLGFPMLRATYDKVPIVPFSTFSILFYTSVHATQRESIFTSILERVSLHLILKIPS